ncbi:hypothetical protein BC831DRAFT_466093 [Entophlyctis helioformis]|nr:hypothetical protein BC831DRAFT_466093 [Entophlyctis helioformis]
MPANWLGSRSNLDEASAAAEAAAEAAAASPMSPGFEDIQRIPNPSLTKKRRVFINIPIDDHFKDKATNRPIFNYKSNKIRTSKYTLVTFLVKNLYEQFRGIATFTSCRCVVTAAPIIIIVGITACKDAIEDWKRHESDNSVNKASTYLLDNWTNTNYVHQSITFLEAISVFFKLISKFLSRGAILVITGIFSLYSVILQGGGHRGNANASNATHPSKIFAQDYVSEDLLYGSQDSLGSVGKGKLAVEKEKPRSTEAWLLSKWEDVKVGDFVFLRNNDNIPADIVIVSTSEPDSACYIETKNLDGETNLKIKKGIADLQHVRTPEDCRAIRCHLDSEPPNPNLYTYTGTMVLHPPPDTADTKEHRRIIPLSNNGVVLRGCVLRNTQWMIGIAVYTGPDSKIMLNSGATPSKRSRVDRQINPQVMLNFMILTGLCLVCGLTAAIYAGSFLFETAPFAGISVSNIEGPLRVGILTFFRCMIIFQNIIPIALYISLDVTKTFQSFMIHLDEDMVDPESGKAVTAQSGTCQIEYIFSDKTGTLTSNLMEFRKASINGVIYGLGTVQPPPVSPAPGVHPASGAGADAAASSSPPLTKAEERLARESAVMREAMSKLFDTKYVSQKLAFVDPRIPKDLEDAGIQARKIREFFTLLAVCHTVLIEKPDKDNPNDIIYKAQSPDEAALVSAAKDTGFACLRRVDNEVDVDVMGVPRSYTILSIIEFNSDRKRMSVFVRRPEGEILLMCKGADSVIYERLSANNDPALCEATSNHLSMFANEGLRTLCLAYRIIPEQEYQEWREKYLVAQSAIENRDAECDALQDGVPECVGTLAKAGIKIWVLTGDKMETAINIGFACNLLKRDMILIVIKSKSHEDTLCQLREALCRFWTVSGAPMDGRDYGMIIDGDSLKFALDPTCKQLLLELGCRCRAVVCCRVSPLQKAMVVQLVRKGLSAMCLAIGDGANDVSMIQEADIGVGIRGKEGMQAVMASDYAIGQFRFLSRLLLVHGRWAYLRSSQLVLNYFYKNVVWLFILFWHQFYCGFSAGLVTDFTYGMFYNTVFSLLPTLFIGSFDQDVNDRISLQVPQLYLKGIRQTLYNMEQFWRCVADGIFQSLVCYFFGFLLFMDESVHPNGYDMGVESMGTTISFSAIFIINLYAVLNWCSWTYTTHIALWPTLAVWTGYVLLYASQPSTPAYGLIQILFRTPQFYLCVVLSVVTGLFPRVAFKFVQQYFMPTDTDIVREIQKYQWKEGMQLSLDLEQPGGSQQASKVSTQNVLYQPESTAASHEKIHDDQQDGFKRNKSEVELQKLSGGDNADEASGLGPIKRTRSDMLLQSERASKVAEPQGPKKLSETKSAAGSAAASAKAAARHAAAAFAAATHLGGSSAPTTGTSNADMIGVSTDGFGAAIASTNRLGVGGDSAATGAAASPGVAAGGAAGASTTASGTLAVEGDHRARRTSFSNVIKTSVNYASQIVRRIAHNQPPNVNLARSARASSLVFMGDNGGLVANTGFAFSQDSGMSDVITPTVRTRIDVNGGDVRRTTRKGRSPSAADKLRNLSSRLQNVLHIGSRSNTNSTEGIDGAGHTPQPAMRTLDELAEDIQPVGSAEQEHEQGLGLDTDQSSSIAPSVQLAMHGPAAALSVRPPPVGMEGDMNAEAWPSTPGHSAQASTSASASASASRSQSRSVSGSGGPPPAHRQKQPDLEAQLEQSEPPQESD